MRSILVLITWLCLATTASAEKLFLGPALKEPFYSIEKGFLEAPSEYFFVRLAQGCRFEATLAKRRACFKEVVAMRNTSKSLETVAFLLFRTIETRKALGEEPPESEVAYSQILRELRQDLLKKAQNFLRHRRYMRQVLVTYSA